MQCINDTTPRARKPHRCTWCGLRIKSGHLYNRTTWVEGSDLWCQKAHPVCLKMLRDYSIMTGYYDDPMDEWGGIVDWCDNKDAERENAREYQEMIDRHWLEIEKDKWTVEGLVSL